MLGEFEQVVLLAVLRVGSEAYGVSIRRELRNQIRRDVTLATVYTTLARLETKGLLTARLGEPTPERGGRRKKYYDVTAAGRRALAQSVEALRRMTRGLDLGWESP